MGAGLTPEALRCSRLQWTKDDWCNLLGLAHPQQLGVLGAR